MSYFIKPKQCYTSCITLPLSNIFPLQIVRTIPAEVDVLCRNTFAKKEHGWQHLAPGEEENFQKEIELWEDRTNFSWWLFGYKGCSEEINAFFQGFDSICIGLVCKKLNFVV